MENMSGSGNPTEVRTECFPTRVIATPIWSIENKKEAAVTYPID